MKKPATAYSLEAEQAVLACLLQNNKLIKKIELLENDFYLEKHRLLYHTINTLHEDGVPPDLVTVVSALKKNNILDEVGGSSYVAGLSECGFVVANWTNYAEVVRQFAVKRNLLELATRMQRYASNGTPELGDDMNLFAQEFHKIKDRIAGKSRTIADRVREWVLLTDGNFLLTDIYRDLALLTRDNKMAAIMAMQRLEKDGVVIKCGEKRGCYRPIQADAPEIDFMNADTTVTFPLTWPYPFDLHKLVTLYPKNVVVVAGASNAGKTALLLNLVHLNLHQADFRIRYMSSEMGAEELKLRLGKFEDTPLEYWENRKLRFLERSSNFSDLVDPDGLNLIDYLEIHTDFFRVGEEIKKIYDRLRKGIAVIALQKKMGQEVGRGGEFTLEKPRLYLAIDPGKLTIIKAKNWATHLINPNGKQFQFKLVAGCKFLAK